MNRTLREVADCLSGGVTYEALEPHGLFKALGQNCLISVIADGEWETKTVQTACNNSQDADKGALFFCFKGETSDGHLYAEDAANRGATAIIAERDPFAMQRLDNKQFPPVFIVNNSLHALWRIALLQRASAQATIIGITGSAGKTSVKELLAQIFATKGSTEKTIEISILK